MDYPHLPKEELIQEIVKLRLKLEQLQGNEFIVNEHIKQGMHVEQNLQEMQSELFIRISPDLRLIFVNEAFTYFLKRKRDDLIGISVLQTLPASYDQDAQYFLGSLTSQNPAASVDYSWENGEGLTGWRRWTVRAIYDEFNTLLEYQAIGRDITESKKAEEQLRQRINFEHAITKASTMLVASTAPDLNEILRIIGEAMDVDRVFIFEFNDHLRRMNNTYEWCSPVTTPFISFLQDIDTDVFRWGLDKFGRKESIVIADRNNLPPEAAGEKASMEEQCILAALLVPIIGVDDMLLGYIGFDDIKHKRIWKEEDIQCLNMLAEMLGAYWDRKNMEKALQTSEIQFRTLTETAPANIFIWNPDQETSLLYLNTGYASISGYSREEAIQTNYWDFVHPDYRELLKERGIARLHGEMVPDRYEAKFLTKTGEVIWGDLALNTIMWAGEPAIIGVICDITERKQMEEALRVTYDELENRVVERTSELVAVNEKLRQEIVERQQVQQQLLLSEARYRAIVENQSELVLRMLPDKTITYVNEAYCQFFNKKAEDFIGRNVIPTIYSEDQAGVIALFDTMGPGHLEDVHSLRAVRHDGEICWQEWTGKAIVKGKEIIEVQAVGRDVSARKRTEEALQRSEANFRKVAETSPAFITVYNDAGFLYINSSCETLIGYSQEEMFQMAPLDVIDQEYHIAALNNYYSRLLGDKIEPYEILIRSKDGQDKYGYLYADLIDYEGQAATLAMIVDITSRKKMEDDLLQSSKLDSLGILAGGIAHDFNNILTVISGNVSLAKMINTSNDEVTEILSEVEQAALQARDLTQQLLTFSKGGAPIRETASIKDLLQETTGFVLRGSNVSCNYSIMPDLWPVSIDKGQISQVINNLIINADQSMPEGGIIYLSAENISADSGLPSSLKPGKYIKISIQDHGVGILEKHLNRIFDPYFTTKQKGHGLGLATCYSIIKKHDGEISIHSVSGTGTTATIYLPAIPEQNIAAKIAPRLNLQGQGKILIMDDETIIRDTLGKMLRRMGYATSAAPDGAQAIDLYQKAQQANEPFDIVLMDLTIAGGMGGKEAVRKLLEIDPDAKVIVSSGYSNDPVMADYKAYGFCGVLPKPYEIQAVNQILYELLDS